MLLLGYLYAHALTRQFSPRSQVAIHVALLAASFIALPILAKDSGTAGARSDPVRRILRSLAVTVGLPLFLLSSTSPLLQVWYARSQADAAPYRFYAISNTGSMLALVSYPVLVEPWIATSHQAWGWSWAYAAAAVLCAVVAVGSFCSVLPGGGLGDAPPPTWSIQSLWIGLGACGSALLLAITHHISQNIASVPLLWVIPLALYLLTFILCFEGRAWYGRYFFLRLLGVALGAMAYALSPGFSGLPLAVSIPLFCSCLFVCCMFCHGELARLKPDPAHLTSFYLMCSLGGALGALFVAVVAPHIFSGDYELRIAIGCCALLVLVVHHRDPESRFYRARWQPAWLLIVAAAVAIVVSLGVTAREEAKDARVMVRNFYGVLRVVEQVAPNVVLVKGSTAPESEGDFRFRKLMNGTIDHGLQFLSPARRGWPTTYYGPNSGIGMVLRAAGVPSPMNVGVIGLGVGTWPLTEDRAIAISSMKSIRWWFISPTGIPLSPRLGSERRRRLGRWSAVAATGIPPRVRRTGGRCLLRRLHPGAFADARSFCLVLSPSPIRWRACRAYSNRILEPCAGSNRSGIGAGQRSRNGRQRSRQPPGDLSRVLDSDR